MVKPKAITHVGVAVTDLERAISDYCSLFQFEQVERMTMDSEGVSIAMLRMGDSEIELLCPQRKESSIGRFLEKKGEGLHHLAIRVANVSQSIVEAEKIGLKMIDTAPRVGARGAEAAFVHPKSFHGVLLEFYDR